MTRALLIALLVACGSASAPPPPAASEPAADPPLPGIARPSDALARALHEAVVAKGPAYRPHTRDLAADGTPAYTNRLIREASPYLLQHAHNPMNWFAWGDAAFAKAEREHKLVLVSVGYATCHWCHVMEDDSFEDPEVAAYVNANYVCIKVDREERPDVDAVYLDAVVAMTGDGGWPLNVVVDAQRRPVFGATFLEKDRLLSALRQIRAADPGKLATVAEQVQASLAGANAHAVGQGQAGADAVERGARSLAARFDATYGGFGTRMKFPDAPDLELLLRYARRTGDPKALAIVTRTLRAMAAGGIHDQLGGGFHRYATDRAWLVPHFEKMLYDNAQLAIVYVEAAQLVGAGGDGDARAAFEAIARTTLDYLLRDMQSPDGGFYGASDADSPDPDRGGARTEGRYFTWAESELDARERVLFHVGEGTARVGDRWILHADGAIDPAVRAKLLAARATRPPPARDDKVIASWNGLAISALAKVGFALGEPRYIAAAERAAALVRTRLRDARGDLARSYREGRTTGAATLTDYASVLAGLLDLYAADGDAQWYAAAKALADRTEARFADPAHGAYFMTPAGADALLVRLQPLDDSAEPSPNAVLALAWLRLAELTGDDAYRTRAEAIFGAGAALLASGGGSNGLRAALEAYLDAPLEIAIVSPDAGGDASALVAEVRRAYLPNATVAIVPESRTGELPFLDGKRALDGKPTAFVCVRTACREPTHDPAVLARQLARAAPLYPDRSPAPL